MKCQDFRWRRLLLVLAVVLVLLAALFLYTIGVVRGEGLLYEFAVIILFLFALLGAIAVALQVYALFKRWCERRGAPAKGRGTRENSGPSSVHLPSTIYKRPDPLLYSQYFLMSKGLAVTWDNPDIWLTELPAPDGTMANVASNALLPDHTYRIHARIYNNSLEAPAVGMPVIFSFLTFGIGIVPSLIGVSIVDLPVKGAIGHPALTFRDWHTPAAPGHFCIQIGLFWPDDAEPGNNLGQENVDVKKTASPATFIFPVRNDSPHRRQFRLEVDAYSLPTIPNCPPHDRQQPDVAATFMARGRDPSASVARLAAHRRETHPLPTGWTVVFSPAAEFVLAGGEQIAITATVNVTGAVPTPRPVNVNAFADGNLAGGVTLYVHT